MVSLQYSESELPMADEEDGADGIPKIDSGFGGSEQILPSKLEEEINKTSPKLVVKVRLLIFFIFCSACLCRVLILHN